MPGVLRHGGDRSAAAPGSAEHSAPRRLMCWPWAIRHSRRRVHVGHHRRLTIVMDDRGLPAFYKGLLREQCGELAGRVSQGQGRRRSLKWVCKQQRHIGTLNPVIGSRAIGPARDSNEPVPPDTSRICGTYPRYRSAHGLLKACSVALPGGAVCLTCRR